MASTISFLLLACASVTYAHDQISPTVKRDSGTFVGVLQGSTNTFLGIPFAQRPVGDLRFRLPVPTEPYEGVYNATTFSMECPQQVPPFFIPQGLEALTAVYEAELNNPLGNGTEDCLTLNVWAPAGTSEVKNLPVIAWISGGGFEQGGTAGASNDPRALPNRSIVIQEPFVFVSMNYRFQHGIYGSSYCTLLIVRLAFGFLASQEVKDAGVANVGLHDQRQALRWIQKYIPAFNGDPSKLTLLGWSAGTISISLQMLANDGDTEGLFHGAFIISGAPIVTNGEKYYDEIVSATGSGAKDTLQCLRKVPYETLKQAQDASPSIDSYQALNSNLAWAPRADESFSTRPFPTMVSQVVTAKIPFVTGNVDDEGTAFTMWDVNITSDAQLKHYLTEATEAEVDTIIKLYPEDPSQGSPYGTGSADNLTPEFKRLAAFHGDLVFQGLRRFFLQPRQYTWSFLGKLSKSAFPLGSSHGTDLPFFLAGPGIDYIVHFVNDLDPNGVNGSTWPKYTMESPRLLTIYDDPLPLNITQDTFRADAIQYLGVVSRGPSLRTAV